jgi:hypothetical protein
MDTRLWIHFAVVVSALDVIAFLFGVAAYVDRRMIEPNRHWRIGLRTALILVALLAANLSVFCAMVVG